MRTIKAAAGVDTSRLGLASAAQVQRDALRDDLAILLGRGQSVRGASEQLGVPLRTAQRWAGEIIRGSAGPGVARAGMPLRTLEPAGIGGTR